MRFVSIRAAARARRRFVTAYDHDRGYVYRCERERNGYVVGVYSTRGTFLTYI